MRIEALEPAMGNAGKSNATVIDIHSKNKPENPSDKIAAIQLDPRIAEALALGMAVAASGFAPHPIPTDLHEILEQLDIPRNKLMVLRLLSRSEWIKLLYLMPKKLLLNGLYLFDKQKLLRLMMWLPPEFLLKMLLRIISIDKLVKTMPTRELMRILRSRKLSNRDLIKGLKKMNPTFVHLLLTRIYGNYDFTKLKDASIWQIIMQTDRARLNEALKTLPFKALMPMVAELIKRDPELLLLLSEDFIYRTFDKMDKQTLIDACEILPEDLIIKMLCNLPDPLLLMAVAQVDDTTLENYLLFNRADLLYTLAGAA